MTDFGGYQFQGAYSMEGGFNKVAGVYVITGDKDNVLDVGETDNLQERMSSHEREDCWKKNSQSAAISLYFHSESNSETRLDIESQLRKSLDPTCGDR